MKQIGMKQLNAPDYFVQSELDRLRVSIGFSGAEKKLIMFTSSEPNEGKSYISLNIWADLAKSGKRVCFLDCDMRKSTLRSTLQLSTGTDEFKGLAHYLSGQAELTDVVYSTELANGYLIPTTTMVNPSFLLEEKRFDDMLTVLRREFDYVIIDTPPLGLVSDGQKIASKVDGCILVIRAHATPRSMVQGSLSQLEQANCPLLGTVLNRVDQDKEKGSYSSGYYSRRYGYGRRNYYSGYYSYYYYSDRHNYDRQKNTADTGVSSRIGEEIERTERAKKKSGKSSRSSSHRSSDSKKSTEKNKDNG